jgi:hypothetical protein
MFIRSIIHIAGETAKKRKSIFSCQRVKAGSDRLCLFASEEYFLKSSRRKSISLYQISTLVAIQALTELSLSEGLGMEKDP